MTENIQDQLVDAAEESNVDLVLQLLENGAEVDGERSTLGTTALSAAVANGRLGVAQILVKRGADPKKKTSALFGIVDSPIEIAIRNRDRDMNQHRNMIKLLEEASQ